MENSKKPDIRFTGFTEAWEQRSLGEISVKVTEKNAGLQYIETFTNSAEFGVISQKDYFDHSISKIESLDGYHIVRSEDFVYNPRISVTAPVGPINRNKLGRNGVMSPLYTVFRPHEVDNTYLEHYFKSRYWHAYMNFNGDSGARSDRFSIKDDLFFQMPIPLPDIDEQIKIGEYLTNLDALIALHERKCERLQNVKKSMLEKMFPKKGSNVPEIRFAGFTEPWEMRKLGDVADYKKGPFGSALKKEIFVPKSIDSVKVYEQQNVINKNWRLERYFISKEYANELKAFETHCGDILVSCAGTIGELYELPIDSESGVINQALMRIRINEKIVLKTLYMLLFSNMIDDFSKEHSNGSAMKNIPPFADLKSMTAMFPVLDEQTAIGTFFCNLDNLITLHQRELEKLKNIKKSMLEKMFV